MLLSVQNKINHDKANYYMNGFCKHSIELQPNVRTLLLKMYQQDYKYFKIIKSPEITLFPPEVSEWLPMLGEMNK